MLESEAVCHEPQTLFEVVWLLRHNILLLTILDSLPCTIQSFSQVGGSDPFQKDLPNYEQE